ncbi:MAG: PAS domain S-box-containing protein [Rhodothermales bacterium]|jgi:PAS domain S-box-containing protein
MSQNEFFFQKLLEHMPDAIYFKDRDGRFMAASNAVARYFGKNTAADIIGKSDADFFPSEQAAEMSADERDIMETGKPMIWKDERELLPDGRDVWFSSTKLPLVDDDGEVIGILGISREETLRKDAEAKLRAREAELSELLSQARFDLDRARTIHQSFLPAQPPEHPRVSAAYRHLPRHTVSGDYFNFRKLADGNIGIFMGDVAGHGVAAALYMSLIKFVTDRLFAEFATQPSDFLKSLNGELAGDLTSCSYITAIQGYFDFSAADSASFRYAGAGHPAPILHRPSTGEVRTLPMENSGAAGLFDSLETATECIELQPGDRLLLVADGITQTCNEADDTYEDARLAAGISETGALPLDQALDAIIADASAFRGASEASDDIALIGFEVT